MILSLFAVGAIGFWVALVVLWAVMTWAVEMEKGWGATLTMGAAIGFALLVGKSDILSFAANHWIWLIAAVPIYLAAGTGWGISKWKWLVVKARMKYDELRGDFEGHDYGINDPLELKARWASIVTDAGLCGSTNRCRCTTRPLVRQHKALILMWMCCWPWSLVWALLNDPIRQAFRYIYAKTAELMDAMSKKTFASTEVHLMTSEEKKTYEAKQRARHDRG